MSWVEGGSEGIRPGTRQGPKLTTMSGGISMSCHPSGRTGTLLMLLSHPPLKWTANG